MRQKTHKTLKVYPKIYVAIFLSIMLLFPAGISFSKTISERTAVRREFKERFNKGKYYYNLGMYEAAVKEWEGAVTVKPKDRATERLIKKAQKKLEKEKKKEAKKKEKKVTKLNPRKEFRKHISAGRRYYNRRMYEEAIGQWEEALSFKAEDRSAEQLIEKAKKKIEKRDKLAKFIKKPGEVKKLIRQERKLSIEECIEIAMQNHIPLKTAKKQLKLAQFRLLEAQRKLGPTVTAKLEYSDGQINARYYDGEKYLAEIKQPVFYGGELVFSVKQARVNVEIVRTDYDRIKNELILQVKKAYYNIDKSKKALEVQQELEKRGKELYDITKRSYEASIIPQVEHLKVSSQYNQSAFQVISAEEDLSVANLILQQTMNIDEDIAVEEVGEPETTDIELESCYSLAYLNRAEIKISKLSIEYFECEKRITKARSDWPRIDFLGSYGNTREDFLYKEREEGLNPRHLGPEYYVGTKVSVPFFGTTVGYSFTKEKWQPVVSAFQGTKSNTHTGTIEFLNKLEDISGAQEAELEYIRAEDDFNKKKQEIALEVKETFFKYKKATRLIDVSKIKVAFQSKQAEVLEIRRSLGESQASDVMEELLKLAEEKFAFVQAIADYYIAISSLNKAIGIDGYFKTKRK